MSNTNRDYLIVCDVKNSKCMIDRKLVFYLTDENTSNIFIRLVTKLEEYDGSIIKYIDIEPAENFVVTMRCIKPNNETFTIGSQLLEEGAIYQFDLPESCKDIPGTYKCELLVTSSVYGRLEYTTSDMFTYEVKRSILSNVPEIIETEDCTVEKLLDRLDKLQATLEATKLDTKNRFEDIVIRVDYNCGDLEACKCDGVTDDADRLQAFVDYVASIGGGQLLLPRGKTIMIRKEIELKDNVSIVGYGNNSKIITDYGSSKNALNMLYAIEKKNIYLSNFYIENTGYGMSGTWEPAGTFTNVGAPILAAGCDNFVVDNCYVVRGGNTIDGEGVANIYFSCCSNSKAINNYVKYGDNGIMCDTWYNQLTGKSSFCNNGIVFANNTVTQMGGRGICIENKEGNSEKHGDVVIANNTITNCAYAGIQGNNPLNSVITGNVIDGSGTNRYTNSKAPTFFGIALEQNSRDCVINGNTIKYCYQNGIRCIEALDIIISNNNIMNMLLRPSQAETDDTQYREGIFIKNTSNNMININVLNNNIYDMSNGINLADGSTNKAIEIKYCMVVGNNITFKRATQVRNGILLKNVRYSQINTNNITVDAYSSELMGIYNQTSSDFNTYNDNTIMNCGIGLRFTNDDSSIANGNMIMGCNKAVQLNGCLRTSIDSKIKNCPTAFDVTNGKTDQADKCRAFNCFIDNSDTIKTGTGLIVKLYRSTAPTGGTWDIGDRVINIAPAIDSYEQWIYYASAWKGINKLT